ncbi:MAG: hemolysin family protein [Anaerolineales bacterium]
MINISFGLIGLAAALILDLFLASARAAFINSRLSQLKSFEEEGLPRAGLAVRVLSDAHRLILSMRIAHTFSRILVIGVALITFMPMQFASGVSGIAIIAGILAGAGLLIGLFEFLSESIVLRKPEQGAIRLAPFAAGTVFLFAPIGWLLFHLGDWSSSGGDKLFPLITEEEIMTMVDAGEEEGVIEEEEKAMIYSIFQLDNTLAREVMVPRIDIIAFEENTSLREATEILLSTGHSRAPVFGGSIDNIVGLIYIKDLLASWQLGELDKNVSDLLREPYFVPEAKVLDDLLAEMQAKRVHIAVVVDEYGGTAGLVTIEDVVEEIVGEILDEYDFAEELAYEQVGEGIFTFSGGIDIDDVNQITGARVPKETSETLGGLIYSELGKVPVVGETVDVGGLHLVVEKVVGRRIRKIRANVLKSSETEPEENGNHARRKS